jgi:hypothetical protein
MYRTPGCNCASRGLPEEHHHGGGCPYGLLLRDPSVQDVIAAIVEQIAGELWVIAGVGTPWNEAEPENQARFRKAAANTLLAEMGRQA